MQPDSKQCTTCAATKPLPEFSKAPRGKYGRKSRCKACDAVWAAANKQDRRFPPGEVERRLRERRGATKQCKKCGEVKDRSQYSKSNDGKYGPILRPECKPCQSAASMAWHRNNPERANANRRRWNLKKTYGITEAQYDEMLQQQGGVCAICGMDEPNQHGRTGTKFKLSIDHDHETGAVRSLLCQKCNRAIGLLGDSHELVQKAAEYLLRHRSKAIQ